MLEPKLVVMLSEVWTMVDPRDLAGLVELGAVAEQAGADGVLIGEHIVLAENSAREGLPQNPREWLGAWDQDPRFAHPSSLELLSAIAATTTTLRLVRCCPSHHDAASAHPGEAARHPGPAFPRTARLFPGTELAREGVRRRRRPVRPSRRILDEQLEVWERAWSVDGFRYDGRHYRFERSSSSPRRGPEWADVWIGALEGLHLRALRRLCATGQATSRSGRHRTATSRSCARASRPQGDHRLRSSWRCGWGATPRSRCLELQVAGRIAGCSDQPSSTRRVDVRPQAVAVHRRSVDLGDLCRDALNGLRERAE